MALERVVQLALDALKRRLGDKTLEEALSLAAEFDGETRVTTEELLAHLQTTVAGDGTRLMLHQQLAEWDAVPDANWTEGTTNQTRSRRDRVYQLLDLTSAAMTTFGRLFPPHLIEDPGFEIARRTERWYDEEQADRGFYWPRYREHLRTVEDWGIGVEDLSRATRQVVERLGRPDAETVTQARGLVVGYVQSGKTANFTGVIARAIDAGYRLVIVLAGTTNLLRSQTQRRLDKQLIGSEVLAAMATTEQYELAPDWKQFISHGGPPAKLGSVNVDRLTGLESDYRRLGGGLAALQFEAQDLTLPINAPANLAKSSTRLIVMKKNRAPLESLAKDLEAIAKSGVSMEQIPTLIIDDESDQASINTKKPSRKEIDRRTSINRAIIRLLTLLPRAQYVGYTATPFANVFVDPNDEIGVFPRDFILGLDRPGDYMGATRYHDFGEDRPGFASNERAYVRAVFGGDLAEGNLQKAVDLFLLTGAMKLYRAERDCRVSTKHHTMLVHTSEKTAIHRETAKTIRTVLEDGGYLDGSAESRLEDLLEEDLRPVSAEKAPDLPFPDDYGSLRPYIARCLQRVQDDDEAVLIVNGRRENEDQSPDFDRDSVWAIIVGGTKLSRGYTVEGLTVSYYRRAAGAADTLMQMGRWFGFRRNYEDLMRLFIGRAEGSKKRPIDLYRAFEAVCRDELELRRELRRYALPDSGDPVTPRQVPPLVTQHLPSLPPTAPSKMWNARLLSENFGGKQIARTLAPTNAAAAGRNERRAREMISSAEPLQRRQLGPAGGSFAALVGEPDSPGILRFLETYEWSRPDLFERVVNFLRGDLGSPGIDRWWLILPMLERVGEMGGWTLGGGQEIPVIERFRDPDTGRFGVYTTPQHVRAARAIATGEELELMTAETRALAKGSPAAALLYPVRATAGEPLTVGFSLFPPPNKLPAKTKWGVHSPEPDYGDEPAAIAVD